MSDELLTVSDVCKTLNVSADTVRARIREGVIPAIKIGRRWYVSATRLQDVINGMFKE